MNNDRIHKAIESLHKVLKEECGEYVVACEIFLNYQEYQFTEQVRTPDSLDMKGISMRNINGEWIR